MKEKDIRNLDKVREFFQKEEEWTSQFIDASGLVRDEFVDTVSCPCCRGSDARQIMTKNSFSLCQCSECATIYANPRFSQEMLDDYSSREKRLNYANIINEIGAADLRKKEIFSPRARLTESMLSKLGKEMRDSRLLDIGCASGQFLSLFDKDRGPEIYGVEASSDLAVLAQQAVPWANILALSFEDCEFEPGFFDVITIWEVLEHIFDPFNLMVKVKELLKPGGILLLSVPNIDGFDIQVLWDKGNAFSPPSHLNYYRKSTIEKLFNIVGLKVKNIITPGLLDVDIVRNRIDLDPDIKKKIGEYLYGFIKDDSSHGQSTRKHFQNFLSNSGLSSHMLITVQKP